MVNLEKWEAVTVDDLKVGDKVKRITTNTDGTIATVTGVLSKYDAYTGVWLSKDNFRLVDRSYCTELYRRKPDPFIFPNSFGAVIVGTHNVTGRDIKMVFDEVNWRGNDGFQRYLRRVKEEFNNLRVLRYGLNEDVPTGH